MSQKQKLGRRGEEVAVEYLEANGYRVMDRNYRFQRNEIDVVCYEPNDDDSGGELVFVEVKTRSSLGFGSPEEAVTDEKKEAIRKVTGAYLYERDLEGAPSRFDVISVVLRQNEDPEVEHFKNAFYG